MRLLRGRPPFVMTCNPTRVPCEILHCPGRLAGWVRLLRGRPPSVVLGGDALAAHALVDPATGRLVTFSHRVRLGLRGPVTRLTVYEFDQVGSVLALTP